MLVVIVGAMLLCLFMFQLTDIMR